ncbi:MAG TPA: translation elongation factor Ts [Steroidobacteraceae bacterium]|jgi:elongation factor Ts|nr:translation elongation factor Ts [Steroidobacteraceae bacterium]HXC20700.1 translation elongation factor Ts [Steroidobacteraceae bacterium]
MNITADSVKQLRERTGAGMMECKKALVETQGDLDAAAELMRKSGLSKADKKAARVAAEGSVAIERSGSNAVLVEVNCETDFVARSDEFQAFAKDVARAALAQAPASLEALLALPHGAEASLDGRRRALIAKIGENISVRRFVRVTSPGPLGTYAHGSRIGSLVALQGGDEALAKDLAMHVAASNPAYIDIADVPAETLDKERAMLVEQTKAEKKPPEIIAKMVEGRLRKYVAEITLVGQPFVKDLDISIEKLLKGAGAKVVQFVRYEVGAGIEKKQDDFVGEVMKQVKAQEKDPTDGKHGPKKH